MNDSKSGKKSAGPCLASRRSGASACHSTMTAGRMPYLRLSAAALRQRTRMSVRAMEGLYHRLPNPQAGFDMTKHTARGRRWMGSACRVRATMGGAYELAVRVARSFAPHTTKASCPETGDAVHKQGPAALRGACAAVPNPLLPLLPESDS